MISQDAFKLLLPIAFGCDLAVTGYLPLNTHRQLSYIFTFAEGGVAGRIAVQWSSHVRSVESRLAPGF